MKKLLIIALMLLTSGCASTTPEDVEIVKLQTQQQEQLMKFHRALASKPTYKIKCTSGCDFEIYDGDELPPLPVIDHFISANEANARMFESGMRILPNVVGWVAGAKILSDAFDASGGNNSTIHNTSTISGDDNQINATAEMTGATSSVNTIGDTTTKTATDISSVDNSAVDNSVIDSYNATAAPTVVNQPGPVIVPATIVNQPPPVVVNPSYPPIN